MKLINTLKWTFLCVCVGAVVASLVWFLQPNQGPTPDVDADVDAEVETELKNDINVDVNENKNGSGDE